MQTFDISYTMCHIDPFFGKDVTIMITSPTAREWSGRRVRMNRDSDERATMTTWWVDVVKGAKLEEGDICMFLLYNVGSAMGCTLIRLNK